MKAPILLFAAVSALALGSVRLTGPQLQTLPGSVVRGERTLTTNGCLNCHALDGKGGTRAPDLGTPSKTARTPALFASSLWNHMPTMLAEVEASQAPAPRLNRGDAADLFAYFYSTLYFSPKGSARRGGNVFVEKQCVSCHSEVLDTNRRPSIVETWMDLKDPTVWAERMWNHAAAMESATSNRGILWPRLSDQDVVDVVTFLSTRAGTQTEAAAFSIGEPEIGRSVFDRSCTSCHTLGQREGSKVDLLSRSGPNSVTGYIAEMWNHAPEMKKKGGTTPKLTAGEMSDLVAFLFSQRYFFEPGDPKRGERLYESKSCSHCHDVRRRETGAPDLSRTIEAYSPIILTSAAWQHGTAMMRAMKQQRIDWPEFKGREMADLIAYLNTRLIIRVAEDH